MIEPAKAKVPSANPEAPSNARDRRLVAYALAVGAGLAAAPELADASIVYTDPLDTTISDNGQSISINLDNSGPFDLNVYVDTVSGAGYAVEQVRVTGLGQPAGVIGPAFPSPDASALPAGAPIGPAQTFRDIQFASRLMAEAFASSEFGSNVDGPWANTAGQFLGVTFQIAGVAHFGWVRFDVSAEAGTVEGFPGVFEASVIATLLDYAYESCPREGIVAGLTTGGASCGPSVPLPPSLGLLALGAAGLGLWRLRKN